MVVHGERELTHTSWYNETLGTATRGTRKEFPSVAVIVAEQNFITTYDGDDPDLPMWMVFNTIADGVNQSGQEIDLWFSSSTKMVYALGQLTRMKDLIWSIIINFINEMFNENGQSRWRSMDV